MYQRRLDYRTVSDARSNDNREVSCIFDSLLNSPWGYLGLMIQ